MRRHTGDPSPQTPSRKGRGSLQGPHMNQCRMDRTMGTTQGETNMPVIGPSRRLRRMQWIAIVLVTAAIALNYMDRSTLAIGNLKIREEFGVSATALGALGSAWALTYGLAQLPSGYLLDRIGPKMLVGVTMVVWSLFQAAGGIAGNYIQLMLSRI